jgi:S1-C subfamily serine protease
VTRDLALLSADLPISPLQLESTVLQRQGDPLLVFGYPLPGALGVGGEATVSRGLLSALRQENGVTVLQTDAAINPGNSGGPVVNSRGNVIGVISYKIKESTGLNFAIAADSVQAFLAAPAAIQSPPPTGNQNTAGTPSVTATPLPAPPPPRTLPPQPLVKAQFRTKNGIQTIESMFWELQKLGYRGPTDDGSIIAAFAQATGAPVSPSGTFTTLP